MTRPLLLALLLLALTPPVLAAKSDLDRPLTIDAGNGSLRGQQAAGRVELEGPVVVSKGSLLLRATRLVAINHGSAFQVLASSSDATPMRFSQNLDRPGASMEAVADAVDYDERNGIARFSGNARLRILQGGQLENELSANQISYDTVKGEVLADGKPLTSKPGEGGLRIIMMPRPASSPASGSPGLPLQTAPALTPKPPSR